MDIQMKRGFWKSCVLAALLEEDSYGYKIIRRLSGRVEITESTLYPILRRLESAGALSAYSVEHDGRLRRYYRITDEGARGSADFSAIGKASSAPMNMSGGNIQNMKKTEFFERAGIASRRSARKRTARIGRILFGND